jgi:hypothetical protein
MTDDEYADVRTLLREHAASPQHRVDVDEVIRRGRRARRIRRADRALAVGTVLAVVVAAGVLVAGVLVARPHESTSPVGPSPTASSVALPTSDWAPGDPANLALLTGTLTLEANGCVVVDAGGGALTAVVWPRGTTGRKTAGGAVEILAPDGSVAAATGDRVAVGGGAGGTPVPNPCVTAYGGAFVVMQAPPYTADRGAPKAVVDAVANARREGTFTGPVEWIETTRNKAAALTRAVPEATDLPVYVVQMQGDFVLDSAPRPAGATSPRGTVLMVILPVVASDQFGGEVSLTNTAADLGPYGTVHVLYP